MKKNPNQPARSFPISPEDRARLDSLLTPKANRLIRHYDKRPTPLIADMKAALRAGDPEPFFRWFEYSPDILTNKEVWGLTIGKWFVRHILRTPEGKQAHAYLKRIGSILIDMRGASELPEEKRKEHNRQRQQAFREKIVKAEDALLGKVRAATNRLQSRAEKARVFDAVIAKALDSTDSHYKQAAQNLKKKRDRLRKRASM